MPILLGLLVALIALVLSEFISLRKVFRFFESIFLKNHKSKVIYIHLRSLLSNFQKLFFHYFKPAYQNFILCSNKQLMFASFVIIFLCSCSFGLWFKIKQISIASERIVSFYPLAGYAISTLKTFLIFCTLWLGLVLLSVAVDRMDRVKVDVGGSNIFRNFFFFV